jgi:hypothetical protein
MPLVFRDTGTSGTQIDVLSNDPRIAHIGREGLVSRGEPRRAMAVGLRGSGWAARLSELLA